MQDIYTHISLEACKKNDKIQNILTLTFNEHNFIYIFDKVKDLDIVLSGGIKSHLIQSIYQFFPITPNVLMDIVAMLFNTIKQDMIDEYN